MPYDNKTPVNGVSIPLTGVLMNIYTHVLDKKMDEELQKFGSAKTQEREAYAGLDVKKVKITALSHC